MTSYYAILGVSRNASKAAIRAAYLQKAKRYHPDINQSPQALELFKAVQEAYQVLADDVKRQEFDLTDVGTGAYEPRTEATTKSNAAGTAQGQSSNNAYRFRGRTYNPEAEREQFNQDFYAQAEALRREMENESAELASARRAAWRLYQGFGRYAIFFVLVPTSVIYITMKFYRRLRGGHPDHNSPVLLDMYGRAYIMDRFGRRTRAPRYDDKNRLAQWEKMKLPHVTWSDTAADVGSISRSSTREFCESDGDSGPSPEGLARTGYCDGQQQEDTQGQPCSSVSGLSRGKFSPGSRTIFYGTSRKNSFPGCVDSIPPTAHRLADFMS